MIAATQSNHPLASVSEQENDDPVLNACRERIRTAGMRVTQPRIALIQGLRRLQGPVSIERIHQEVGLGSCDLVTIYRCLAAFESLGLVRRSYLHNGTCLYEQTINAERRYHIICKRCGHTDPVDYTMTAGIESVLQDRGYSEVSHVVEFFGLCPLCQRTGPTAGPERGQATAVKASGPESRPTRPTRD